MTRFVAVSLLRVLLVVLPSSWLDMLNSFFWWIRGFWYKVSVSMSLCFEDDKVNRWHTIIKQSWRNVSNYVIIFDVIICRPQQIGTILFLARKPQIRSYQFNICKSRSLLFIIFFECILLFVQFSLLFISTKLFIYVY